MSLEVLFSIEFHGLLSLTTSSLLPNHPLYSLQQSCAASNYLLEYITHDIVQLIYYAL